MASHLCTVKSSLSLPLLALAWYLGYGFFSVILPSIAVILSTLAILRKQKQSLPEIDIVNSPEQEETSQVEAQEEKEEEEDEEAEEEEEGQANEYLVSESDCNGRASTSEDSELDWPMQQHRVFTSPDCSDGSISDEESLIEIALPSGQYVGNKQYDEQVKEPSFYVQKEWPKFDMAAFFRQHGINEFNEEENLIEIDLSMGSIKCPTRFQIEA